VLCATPLNDKALAPVNNVPLMVTDAPTAAEDGVNDNTEGGAFNSVPVKVMAFPVVDNPETVAVPLVPLAMVVNCIAHDVGVAWFDVASLMLLGFCIPPRFALLKLYVNP